MKAKLFYLSPRAIDEVELVDWSGSPEGVQCRREYQMFDPDRGKKKGVQLLKCMSSM